MGQGRHTLFGANGSGSAAIEIALERCGVPWRLVQAAPWERGPAVDELARLNPLRQVPTLVLPDGSVLTESAAILIHLGTEHPGSDLLPVASSERAQCLRALVYIAANCYAAIGIVDFPGRWCEGADTDEALAERVSVATRARLHAAWDHFADLFPAAPFLGGHQPGAADLLAMVVSKWAGTRAHLAASRPAFSALLARIESHPSVAPVHARHWPTA